jgi:hypothetical protein
MATQSFTVDLETFPAFKIYGEAANINYFLTPDLTPDADGASSVVTRNISGHTRQQYPGDVSTASVNATTRKVLVDPSRRTGSALPGKSFVLQEIGAEGETERRQFTLKGSFVALHSYLKENAAVNLYMITNTGAKYEIPAAD